MGRPGQGLPADTPENTHCFFAGLGYDARMLQARHRKMWATRGFNRTRIDRWQTQLMERKLLEAEKG